jgi:putative membrane protein
MPQRSRHREVPAENRAGEHLSNERTFLAWVRTNIAVISLGFVLARLSPALPVAGEATAHRLASKALPLGVGMVAFGALLTLLAAWRYDAVNREIEAGLVKTDRALVWFVTIAVTLLAAMLVAYMLVTQ